MSDALRAFLEGELGRVEAELAQTGDVLRQRSDEFVSRKQRQTILKEALRGQGGPGAWAANPGGMWVG